MASIETVRDGLRKMLREESDINAALRILRARIKGQQTLLDKMEIAAAAAEGAASSSGSSEPLDLGGLSFSAVSCRVSRVTF